MNKEVIIYCIYVTVFSRQEEGRQLFGREKYLKMEKEEEKMLEKEKGIVINLRYR